MVATKEETAKALACLCCLKPELVLTEAQVTAWHAALCGYKPKTLNYAAIEVGAMPMAYPSLADLLTVCRRIEPPQRPYVAAGGDQPKGRLTCQEVRTIAARLGLEV